MTTDKAAQHNLPPIEAPAVTIPQALGGGIGLQVGSLKNRCPKIPKFLLSHRPCQEKKGTISFKTRPKKSTIYISKLEWVFWMWLMFVGLGVGARNWLPVSFGIPSGKCLKIHAQSTVKESPLNP